MSVIIYSTTILSAPISLTGSVDGSNVLSVSASRGSTDPDFSHFNFYYSTSPGIDITDPGTYDGILEDADGSTTDAGPHTAPIYIVATEEAYDGEESDPTSEFEAEGEGAPASRRKWLLTLGSY
jgi:hypothetical protein